jgi:hypothetical protein
MKITTDCTEKRAEEFVEAYLLGSLPEDEASAFEAHYFDCPECLAQVEAHQAVMTAVASVPRKPLRAPLAWPVRLAWVGALAATLVLGFLVMRSMRQGQQPQIAKTPVAPAAQGSGATPVEAPKTAVAADGVVAELADLTLPPFRASNLRGQSRNANFDAGMKAYAGKDCASTLKDLKQVPAQDEDALAAHFFTGVCQMHLGDLNGASQTLKGVAGAGDSPQQEAAYYYLAQVTLAHGDAVAARRYLKQTIALRGDFEQRARQQMNKVEPNSIQAGGGTK